MKIELLPITQDITPLKKYLNTKFSINIHDLYEDLYKKKGYHFPWIGYFCLDEKKQIVGVGGFKYAPIKNKIEIAYSTIPNQEGKGYASLLCHQLIEIALKENPAIIITTRTLMEEGPSPKILRKNNFKFNGIVTDEEDGFVWEWVYQGLK